MNNNVFKDGFKCWYGDAHMWTETTGKFERLLIAVYLETYDITLFFNTDKK